MPDAADYFDEEDTDSGMPPDPTNSNTSTPRASLFDKSTVPATGSQSILRGPPETRSPVVTTTSAVAMTEPSRRPANTYENTPVAPSMLPPSSRHTVTNVSL